MVSDSYNFPSKIIIFILLSNTNMLLSTISLLLITLLHLPHLLSSASPPCPSQSATGSIFSGHITVGKQKSLIVIDPRQSSLCYNYTLPYEFMRPPRVAVAIDEFRSKSSNDLFLSVKPIIQQSKLFVPFIVRTYNENTRWSKVSFYFLVEDHLDVEAGYYQIDTGRLGGCEPGKSTNVYLPFFELTSPSIPKTHAVFISGFEISTQEFSSLNTRSPFEVAIAESFTNGTGLIITFQALTITKIHSIYLNFIVYQQTKLSIISGSYVYNIQPQLKIVHTPATSIGRNYARIHGISGFIINNDFQQISFSAQWTGIRFEFRLEGAEAQVQYLSYSYFFITGSQCQNCIGYPITHNGICLKECPPGTFYTPEKICISCGQGMYWNGTGCVKSCPEGQFLNYASNQCECPPGNHWTGKSCIACSQGRIFNHQTKTCECPEGFIWNGFTCIKKVQCTQGKVWSIFTYSCQCPPATFWNGTYCKRLIPCSDGKVANEQGECICPVNKHWNGQYCENINCTGGQKWNGSACVCEAGLNFNGSFCVLCINGQYWNSFKRSCECENRYTWNGNFCEKQQLCSGGRIWSTTYKQCICEEGKFWNGAQCIVRPNCCCGKTWNQTSQQCNCNKGFHWDGNTCVQCMNGKNWNQISRTCECNSGTQWNGRFCVVVQSCFGGMMWNQNTWSCECPSTTVWKGNYCIANPCINGQIWDQQLQTCICPTGKVFINRTCLPPEIQCTGGRHWNPKTYSCKCPQNQWFDGIKCIPITNCRANQIYNPRNNMCECPPGLVWLQSKLSCGDTTCPVGQMWDGNGCIKIQCPPNSFYNGTQCVCNTVRQSCHSWQYFDGIQCRYFKSQCPPGTSWKSNKCVSDNQICPQGNYQHQGQCLSIPQLCPEPCSFDNYSNSCKCPSNTCPPGSYSSSHSSSNQVSCVPYKKCPGEQIFSPQFLQCMCPDSTRFNFNGEKCLVCPSNKVWKQTKGGKVCQCPSGTFEVGDHCEDISDKNRCRNIPNSFWSASQQKCVCKDGYSSVGVQCICEGVVVGQKCEKCGHKPYSQWKFGICQCEENYYEDNGKCVQKGHKNRGNDTQSLCTVGTFFDSQQKRCLACPDGCLSCTDCYTCNQCRREFYLDKISKLCVEHCGDGQKFVLQCDDGNNKNGDGCSSDCKIEEGYTCRGGSPNNPDSCLVYNPPFLTIIQTGQIRYSESVLVNIRVDYLPKQLLQAAECLDRCSNVLMGQIIRGDKAIGIKSSYIPGSAFSFSMQINFGRPYIGQFELRVFLNPSLQSRYFPRTQIDRDLIVQVNPAYLARIDSELEDEII